MEEKVVVTGGAGFVGSHLCERLVADGYEVYSIDNYFTGSEKNHVDGVVYYHSDASQIDQIIDFSPKYVFHLGEYSRVEQSFEDIELVYQGNTAGIFAVCQFCKKHNSKLIYAGSSTKFADGGEGPTQSPYAWTKSTNTQFVQAYAKWYNIEYAITYFYNVYGEREISTGKYATLIAKFLELKKNNQPLTVTRPGTQVRNFTHVSDIVEGLILVAKDGIGDGYGIGNPIAYSVLDIAEMIDGDLNSIIYTPEKPGNRLTANVETNKTINLGWSPKVNIKDYIVEQLSHLHN